MKDFIAKDCPEGYRFLVQLVDAATQADAHQKINRMFGNRYSSCALYKPGTMRAKRSVNGCIIGNPGPEYVQSPTGFRVYVPKEFRL